MKNNNRLLWVILAVSVIAMLMSSFYNPGLSQADVEKIIKDNAPEIPSVPSAEEIAALVILPEFPEVESADNSLLNEFLEGKFLDEFEEIELEAEEDAYDELEDHDFRIIVDYMISLFEGIDEDSIDVDVDDVDVEVTKLGLKEDEDKCATVTFELEVGYEFEEGVTDDFEEDLVAVFNVCYDEGDFGDEEVELVSLI